MAKKEVGKFRARTFRMEDGEELESILAAGGVNAQNTGDMLAFLIDAGLVVFANPTLKERLGRFISSVWDHPLQQEIEEAEDNEDYEEAQRLRNKKRNLYRRQSPKARNEILRSLVEQEDFKTDFLSSYLSLAPGELGSQIKEEVTRALASMNESLTKLKDNTDSGKEKSENSGSKNSSATGS